MDEIEQLKKQVEGMQEIIIALVLVQDRVTQFKLRKVYPSLDEMMKQMGL